MGKEAASKPDILMVRDIPEEERPREKLIAYGASVL